MPPSDAIGGEDGEALDWARGHLAHDERRLEHQAPWVKVYALSGRSGRGSLRLVPPRLNHIPQGVASLAKQFPDFVPAVIAHDERLGALLLDEPDGDPFDRDDETQSVALVTRYADMQTRARHLPDMLSNFPALDPPSLLPALLAFLDPAQAPIEGSALAGAANFMSESRCETYFRAFTARAPLIEPLLRKAARMPVTINHGDLGAEGITRRPDRTFAVDDWENATAGPAGAALHALFGGCAIAAEFLGAPRDDGQSEPSDRRNRLIDAYVQALENGGYASRAALIDGLPGTVCAGVIDRILSYGRYPVDQGRYRKSVRRQIRSNLSDLLDLCDLLALADRDTAFMCARDYRDNGRQSRAEDIMRRFASSHPSDAQAHGLLAELLHEGGKTEIAVYAYQRSITLAPDDAALHLRLGNALLERLRFDEAAASFEHARRLGMSNVELDPRLAWLNELRHGDEDAGRDGVVPSVTLDPSELGAERWRPERLALGAKLFRQYGVLLIGNAFDETMLSACNSYFVQHYTQYFSDQANEDALKIGDKRYQLSIALEGPFNNPGLYANGFILELMGELLGDDHILGCTVCATSLPGAKDQHLHKDHPALFVNDLDGQPVALPPFAITTMVPLVPIDEKIGTTGVKKGSHLLSKEESASLPGQLPLVPLGSCFLMDMRLSHWGLGNRTEMVRPILNMVYQRHWFLDSKNFTKHPPLRVPPAEFNRVPEEHRRLISWTTHPGPQVNR